MTDQLQKTEQKWLHSCVLSRRKGFKTREKLKTALAEPSKSVASSPTPPSELQTSVQTANLVARQYYLGNIRLNNYTDSIGEASVALN